MSGATPQPAASAAASSSTPLAHDDAYAPRPLRLFALSDIHTDFPANMCARCVSLRFRKRAVTNAFTHAGRGWSR
jgi:hypothetical protein